MRASHNHDFRYLILILFLGVALFFPAFSLTGCSDGPAETAAVANYGTYGSSLAKDLASRFPLRSPGSDQEKSAGDFIIKSFQDLGFQPIVTEFSFKDAAGAARTSRNIVVVIQGQGFTRTDKSGKIENLDRQVIIGAHYDTQPPAQPAAATQKTAATTKATEKSVTLAGEIKEPAATDFNGIHDNASGIGALLTAAREIKNSSLDYDVILIAFGAGTAVQAGARFHASQMSPAELARTDALYCLDSIYAGDKVYAHSGHNSIKPGNIKDYEKRRKLYEATDVFYENELFTNNNFMLYTNQSSIDVVLEGFKEPVLYREWTMNRSDYVPFDELGVPIVFFESFDYDKKTLEDMKESQNPAFGATSGKIQGTRYDTTGFLAQILNPVKAATATGSAALTVNDQLTRRINNIAFIIVEGIRKGLTGAAAG